VLERGRVGRRQLFDCENGRWTVGGRTIHDTSRNRYLTPAQILARSSNIGMAKLVRTLQPAELHETVLRFGFGAATGIELPGESRGMVRDVASWSGTSRDSIAFGQEVGVTALQLAAAIGAVANDGVLVPPRVVLGTMDPDGRVERARRPEPRRVISSAVAEELRGMLERVITSGTGTRAGDSGYRLAGKTGTAQIAVPGSGYSDTEYMASFGGFGPTNAPRLACLVVLDRPRGDRYHGGQVAAPAFSRIMSDALRYLHVPAAASTPPPVLLAADSTPATRRRAAERTAPRGTVPDVRGLSLRDAVATLARHGYRAQVEGEGVVATQRPAPGASLDANAPCRLRLRPQSRVAATGDARRTGG
jgi:cell division protein FtsI (penicillin-binding protein 3)